MNAQASWSARTLMHEKAEQNHNLEIRTPGDEL